MLPAEPILFSCLIIGLAPASVRGETAGTGGPGISAEAVPPDLGCPPVGAIQRVLADRFGRPEPRGATAGWKVVYRGQSTPGDATVNVSLDLRDPGGQPLLHRALSGTDCAALAEAMGIMVETHFREIGWTSGAALPDSPRVARVAATARTTRGVSVGLGPAWLASEPAQPWIAGDVRVQIAGPVDVFAGALVATGERSQDLMQGGVARSTRWPLRLGVEAGRQVGPVRIYLGLEGLALYETARTEGIPQPGNNWRLSGGLGLSGHATWRVSRRWSLSFGAAGYRFAGGDAFVVKQLADPVLRRPPWEGLLTMGVNFALAP